MRIPAERRARALRILATGGLAALLAACTSGGRGIDPDLAIDRTRDPTARYFEGTLVALRPATNTLIISSGSPAKSGPVKYDLHSKFFVDGRPAMLVDLQPYMLVKVRGRMVYLQGIPVDGDYCIDVAKFSSPLPADAPRPAAGK